MDLKVPITITDELTEDVIVSKGWLNLASGEIGRVEYGDYDPETEGFPFESEDYEFTSGTLSNEGKDVEFKVDLNRTTGQYSVSANELLEIKVRAAALFAGVQGAALLAQAGLSSDPAKGGRADKPAPVAPAKTEKSAPRGKPRGARYH